MNWELFDGEAEQGPLTEEEVIDAIRRGLKPTTVCRPMGKNKWKSLREHAPFAYALEEAAGKAETVVSPTAETSAPRAQAKAPVRGNTVPETGPFTMGCAVLFGIGFLWFMGKGLSSSCAPTPVVTSIPTPERASVPEEPVVPRPPPLPAAAQVKTTNGWATVPRPGVHVQDTPENRIKYLDAVSTAYPGEPPLNKGKANAVLQKFRSAFAKMAEVPLSAVKVTIGDSAASLQVADGHYTRLRHGDAVVSYGSCSEPFLGLAMAEADLLPEQFSAVGIRAIVCISNGCTAAFDTRPTSPGGGIYGGDVCISLADVVRAVGQ